ncbi:uncharacterized protein TNCV_3931351 [Trichonephila clavipes]|nr:uncharacterized protein TNCV_3931351 [Trichonephila clavipes]
MEIRTFSSGSNSLRDESSSFDGIQRRSNEAQYDMKKGSDVKHELEEKGINFFRMIRVRDTQIGPISVDDLSDQHLVLGLRQVKGLKETKIKEYVINDHVNLGRGDQKERFGKVQYIEKRGRTEETVAASTSRYNLRPRGGREVESLPAMEMKTQQGGPVRSRKNRGRDDNPYIENEQDQTTRMPDKEVISNRKTKKERERVPADQYL